MSEKLIPAYYNTKINNHDWHIYMGGERYFPAYPAKWVEPEPPTPPEPPEPEDNAVKRYLIKDSSKHNRYEEYYKNCYPLTTKEAYINENNETMEFNGKTYYVWRGWSQAGEETYPDIACVQDAQDGHNERLILLTTKRNPTLPLTNESQEFGYMLTIDSNIDETEYLSSKYTFVAQINEDENQEQSVRMANIGVRLYNYLNTEYLISTGFRASFWGQTQDNDLYYKVYFNDREEHDPVEFSEFMSGLHNGEVLKINDIELTVKSTDNQYIYFYYKENYPGGGTIKYTRGMYDDSVVDYFQYDGEIVEYEGQKCFVWNRYDSNQLCTVEGREIGEEGHRGYNLQCIFTNTLWIESLPFTMESPEFVTFISFEDINYQDEPRKNPFDRIEYLPDVIYEENPDGIDINVKTYLVDEKFEPLTNPDNIQYVYEGETMEWNGKTCYVWKSDILYDYQDDGYYDYWPYAVLTNTLNITLPFDHNADYFEVAFDCKDNIANYGGVGNGAMGKAGHKATHIIRDYIVHYNPPFYIKI